MSTSLAEEEVIPLLDDFITQPAEGIAKVNDPESESTKSTSQNPFLPHDTLAKLAHEREVFKKEFEQFMESQKLLPAASTILPDTQNLESLVHQMTQRIVAEYLPQIEQRVRAEVIRQLNRNAFKD